MSKIERVFLEGDFGLTGLYCKAHDVDKLEARNAELLEALKKMLSIQCYVNYAMHRPKYQKAIEQAKTAIAKAEGGNP